MIQVCYQLRNLSLVLTICNIFLTIRLLDIECPHTDPEVAPHALVPAPIPPDPLESAPASSTPVLPLNPFLGRWDASHLYKLYDSVLIGDKYTDVASQFSVCLATQTSLDRMHSLVQVAQHWSGSISVALFAAGDQEFELLQDYLAYLRQCFSPIRDRVVFHILFPAQRLPRKRQGTSERTDDLDCQYPERSLSTLLRQRSPETIRWRVRNPYPQNHLRNLARRNCQSSYVFLTDIDIIPSVRLAEELDTFLKTNNCRLCAFVVPTYELDERAKFPHNKTDLIRLSGKALARPFHHKVFIYNQYATNFSRWENDSSNKAIHVSHNVTNFEFLYEPFYVAPDTVPAHDERFIGYGFTRNTQVYEMYVAGYQFLVLSPAFTVHWGLQKRKGRPSWRENQNSRNRQSFDGFKREVFARYQKDPLRMIQKDSSDDKSRPLAKYPR